jgi:hypothetical protein
LTSQGTELTVDEHRGIASVACSHAALSGLYLSVDIRVIAIDIGNTFWQRLVLVFSIIDNTFNKYCVIAILNIATVNKCPR